MRAKTEVEAKLFAVKHIIDYYYHAARTPLPQVEPGKVPIWMKDAKSNPEELRLLEIIAHHFACDEIHFTTLYDCCTLLDDDIDEDRAYRRVIQVCANEIRARLDDFEVPSNRQFERRKDR